MGNAFASRGRQLLEDELRRRGWSAYRCDQVCGFTVGYTAKVLRRELVPARAKATRYLEIAAIPVVTWDEPAEESAA